MQLCLIAPEDATRYGPDERCVLSGLCATTHADDGEASRFAGPMSGPGVAPSSLNTPESTLDFVCFDNV